MTAAQVFNGAVNVPTNASNLATACALCSHNCGLRVDVADNKIVEVRADDDHPSTKGYSCNKAYAIANYVNHAQRVTQLLKKLADGSFKAISWDTAILAQEKTQHWLNDRRMIRGTNDIYLTADKHHAKFMLLLGTNPHISNQGANPKEALKQLFRDSERRMVAVDPRITETTRLADRHLRIKPAKDIYLLLAIAAVLVQENLVDKPFIEQHSVDYQQLAQLFSTVNVAEMAQRCGLNEEDIRLTAREFGQTKPACIALDLGIEHSSHNTLTSYLVRVLLVMTGNYGRKGGNIFVQLFGPNMPYWSTMTKALESSIESIPALLPIPQLPPAIIPEEILSQHPDRIRALICDGANPIASYPDTKRFKEAFAQLDLLVVIDPAMSETAQMADYVLPSCTGYEKWEFSIFPKDIIAPQVRPPVVNPMGQALPEVEIYYRLARAMGLVGAAPKFLHRLAKQARKPLMTPAYLAAVNSYALASSKLQGVGAIVARSAFLMYETLGKTLPNPMLAYIWLLTLGYATTRRDQVIRALPEAKAMLNPFALTEYLFAKILANPQGVLLGHYEIEHNFEYYSKHQDGKIRLYFADYAEDLSRLIAQDVEPDEKDYPFVLNGGLRTGFTANTIMRDPSWRKGRAIHASLYMSEADAAALNAKEGDLVKISSKRSSVIAPVKVDKNTLTGHLHLPNILGQYYPDSVTGELKANGIAINELVDLTDRDPYTGCPHTKRIRCKVELVN